METLSSCPKCTCDDLIATQVCAEHPCFDSICFGLGHRARKCPAMPRKRTTGDAVTTKKRRKRAPAGLRSLFVGGRGAAREPKIITMSTLTRQHIQYMYIYILYILRADGQIYRARPQRKSLFKNVYFRKGKRPPETARLARINNRAPKV